MRDTLRLASTALIAFMISVGCGDGMSDDDAGPPLDDAGLADAGTSDAGPGREDGGSSDGGATDAGTTDAGTTDAAPIDGGNTCAAEIAALQAELYESIGTCSVVVRLDHESLSMLGYQVVCGSYTSVSEAAAAATATADTGYGAGHTVLSPTSPEDTYVFYQSPGDFGGASAVNARNGLSVFGGSIVWLGRGDITYPSTWRPASELGSGCAIVGADILARGYDLVGGVALPDTDVSAALGVIDDTAIRGAFWGGGYLFDAVVLRYPRTVGAFDPTSAEWIVIVNGGWLD